MFDSWLRAYEWALDRVLAHKAMMLVVTLATLGRHRLRSTSSCPKGFFPQEDTGFLTGITEAATDTSFEAMSVRQKALADILSRIRRSITSTAPSAPAVRIRPPITAGCSSR